MQRFVLSSLACVLGVAAIPAGPVYAKTATTPRASVATTKSTRAPSKTVAPARTTKKPLATKVSVAPVLSAGTAAIGSSINGEVAMSDAAVIIHVESVSAPGEVSFAGQPQRSYQFRTAQASVQRPIYGSLKPGDKISVFLEGTGKDQGDPYVQFGQLVVRYQNRSGPVAAGDDLLLILRRAKRELQDTTLEEIWSVVENFRGLWHVIGTQAESVDPIRTVPVEKLVDRLVLERSTGRDGRRDWSDRDVLATEYPSTTMVTFTTPPPSLPASTSPTPPVDVQQVASGDGWRAELATSSALLSIRLWETSNPHFGGFSVDIVDGQVSMAPNNAGATCRATASGDRIVIAFADRRTIPLSIDTAGIVWQHQFKEGVALTLAKAPGNGQATVRISDGRTITAVCSAADTGPRLGAAS